MKNEYSFFAVFEYDSDGINISFPDLPRCFSCADANDTESALKNAREALTGFGTRQSACSSREEVTEAPTGNRLN